MKRAAGVRSVFWSAPPPSIWHHSSPVEHLVSPVSPKTHTHTRALVGSYQRGNDNQGVTGVLAQVTGLNNEASLIRDGSIPSA